MVAFFDVHGEGNEQVWNDALVLLHIVLVTFWGRLCFPLYFSTSSLLSLSLPGPPQAQKDEIQEEEIRRREEIPCRRKTSARVFFHSAPWIREGEKTWVVTGLRTAYVVYRLWIWFQSLLLLLFTDWSSWEGRGNTGGVLRPQTYAFPRGEKGGGGKVPSGLGSVGLLSDTIAWMGECVWYGAPLSISTSLSFFLLCFHSLQGLLWVLDRYRFFLPVRHGTSSFLGDRFGKATATLCANISPPSLSSANTGENVDAAIPLTLTREEKNGEAMCQGTTVWEARGEGRGEGSSSSLASVSFDVPSPSTKEEKTDVSVEVTWEEGSPTTHRDALENALSPLLSVLPVSPSDQRRFLPFFSVLALVPEFMQSLFGVAHIKEEPGSQSNKAKMLHVQIKPFLVTTKWHATQAFFPFSRRKSSEPFPPRAPVLRQESRQEHVRPPASSQREQWSVDPQTWCILMVDQDWKYWGAVHFCTILSQQVCFPRLGWNEEELVPPLKEEFLRVLKSPDCFFLSLVHTSFLRYLTRRREEQCAVQKEVPLLGSHRVLDMPMWDRQTHAFTNASMRLYQLSRVTGLSKSKYRGEQQSSPFRKEKDEVLSTKERQSLRDMYLWAACRPKTQCSSS
mmetsp:Transcript_11556/g.30764  ORF Transcript_11556/g.30764 Transcript_11556/m.30764 type:complete len:621 (+) Transcript_11556:6482-8344(+)